MSDEVRLSVAGPEHAPALLEMAHEFPAAGESVLEPLLADPEAYFARIERFARGVGLPADRVQQTEFFLLRGSRILGGSRLRHRLIPVLELDGGNIGYEIRPSERRRGYGARLLALTLEKAAELGLERVLFTVEPGNVGSVRLIEKNGGVPGDSTRSPNTGARMRQYWIELAGP